MCFFSLNQKVTYGDLAKTKTVTRKKYERIVKILNGQEPNNVENSKFRFWVKSKGFRLGPTEDGQFGFDDQDILYVPCIKSTVSFFLFSNYTKLLHWIKNIELLISYLSLISYQKIHNIII